MSDLRQRISGLSFFFWWNLSIFTGYFIFVPLSFLQLFTSKFHRRLSDLIVTYWQFYVTCLLHLYKCDIRVTGDPVRSNETAILISNHRTRVDWNFIWAAMYHAVEGPGKWYYSTKFILKNSIRYIPAAGWVMQLVMYIFIRRNWKNDKKTFDNYIEYVKTTNYKHLLVLFPEGTDLTEKTLTISNEFAKKHDLPTSKHVLTPRSTGFVYLVGEMQKKRCIDAIYDLTLIYPDTCPQNEEELFVKGKIPRKVFAHITRFPINVVPKDEEGLKKFLEKRWSEKEARLETFRKSGRFANDLRDITKRKLFTKRYRFEISQSRLNQIIWILGFTNIVSYMTECTTYIYLIIIYSVCMCVVPIICSCDAFYVRKLLWKLTSWTNRFV